MVSNRNILVCRLMMQKTKHISTLDIQKCVQHALASSHQEVFELLSHSINRVENLYISVHDFFFISDSLTPAES